MKRYRSSRVTQGREMAGARALWRATGMTEADFEKPIIAIANSFTQFVPGHVHHEFEILRRIFQAAFFLVQINDSEDAALAVNGAAQRRFDVKLENAGGLIRRDGAAFIAVEDETGFVLQCL